jgi:nucleoside-diphosphate-sugar epimerase
MRVFVTGATGFIARHLLQELERHGTWTAASVRRELAPDTRWRDAFEGARSVVHLAATAHERAEVLERKGDYETLRRVNALAAERLAREAAAAGVRHMVFLSTIGVCGDETSGEPFTEESPAAPRSLYAASKLEAERLLGAVAAETGLAVTVLRPTLIYGPGNRGNFLRLLRAANRGFPLPLASVRNRRSLTYVGNLVSAIVAILARQDLTGAYVVCDAESLSTPQILRALAIGLGRPARLLPFPPAMLRFAGEAMGQGALVRRLVGSLEADCGKLQRAAGWHPRFAPAAALADTANWFRSQGRDEHKD